MIVLHGCQSDIHEFPGLSFFLRIYGLSEGRQADNQYDGAGYKQQSRDHADELGFELEVS
jgi:hypothetical protein